jgi:hydrogenase expression/formation protein HypE
MAETEDFNLQCPMPRLSHSHVMLAHGGGGRLTQQLIQGLFRPAFDNPLLAQEHDGARLTLSGQELAFTTDAFVVRPLFFPGGDIGTLSIYGTVNDLAMCGARPLWISAAFILEEGLPMDTLQRVVASMSQAARAAGVQLVAGDTKVVERGKGDGLYLTTAGVGSIRPGRALLPRHIQPGDAVLVSGDLGRHGIAILSVREGLEFETVIDSDCAPLHALVEGLFEDNIDVHCLRDLTRGGLATCLHELATTAGVQIHIREMSVPVREDVRGACEILGLDPLYVANEGRLVAFVPQDEAARALSVLRADDLGRSAALIGHVLPAGDVPVTLESPIGAVRVLDLLTGEQLPRIC